MQEIKPRDHQQECLAAIDDATARGATRALVVMASGLGKTYTSAFAIEKFFTGRPFGRVLILCHSEKILRQTKEKFRSYFGEEFSYGMYVNYNKTARSTDFLFATFQTMKENCKNFSENEFTYIIVDEAHHSHARTYFPTIRYFQPEFLLGLTATPDRLDGQKIEEIYGEPVYELGFIEATKRNLIAECDYRLVLDDLSQERLNEYLTGNKKLSINQLNRTLFIEKRDEEIVRLISEHSARVKNPKTMIFCRTIEHARKIAKIMGNKAVLVHKKNSDPTNDCALEAFKEGEIDTIISVDMLNEGVDVPDANIIVFLRNTVSPAVFYQQLGRGTRLSEGKDKVLVLDFVNNCERIKMILELQQEIDDFKLQEPITEYNPHDSGDADSKEKFALNIATPAFKTKMVDIVKLLEKVRTWCEWDYRSIIQAIENLAKTLETDTLTSKDIRNSDLCPGQEVFTKFFGKNAIEKAVKAAGFKYSWTQGRWTGEEIITSVVSIAKDGKMPTEAEVAQNPDLPSVTTIRLHFKTWKNFAKQCNLEMRNELSDEEMLEDYLYASLSKGYWLSREEMTHEEGLLGCSAYTRRFNVKGVYELRNLVTLKYPEQSSTLNEAKTPREHIGKKEIRDALVQITKEKHRAPNLADIKNDNRLPTYQSCFAKFGVTNLAGLWEACGISEVLKTLDPITQEEKPKLSSDERVALQKLVKNKGRRLKLKDLKKENGVITATCLGYRKIKIGELNELIDADAILMSINN